ncbi:MAG: anti-sigma factor [Pseudomonadota bacterium]
MTNDDRDHEELLLQAYCDGELDPASAADIERRLAATPALRAQRDRIMALRGALRALPQDDVPPNLLAGIEAKLAAAETTRTGTETKPARSWSWRALAASAVVGAVLSGAVTGSLERYAARDDVTSQIVAGHIRALLAPQPFDVASSDRHTVKPWFTTRIPESPLVVDLSTQGFTLAGGRVDVLGRTPVATIVYRHAAHVVSLTTLPAGRNVPGDAFGGYNVLSWSDPTFTYVAVSDLPHEDLLTFKQAFIAGAAALR